MDRTSNNFLKSSPAEDKYLSESTSPSDLRERLDILMKKRGIQSRGQSGIYDNTPDVDSRMSSANQIPSSSLPASTAEAAAPSVREHYQRVIYIGNDRYEFFSTDEAAADEKEARLRAAYR